MADRQAQDLRPPFSLNSALAPQSVFHRSSGKDGIGDPTKEGSTDRADVWLSFHRQNNNQDTSTEETTNQSLHKLTFANIQCWAQFCGIIGLFWLHTANKTYKYDTILS